MVDVSMLMAYHGQRTRAWCTFQCIKWPRNYTERARASPLNSFKCESMWNGCDSEHFLVSCFNSWIINIVFIYHRFSHSTKNWITIGMLHGKWKSFNNIALMKLIIIKSKWIFPFLPRCKKKINKFSGSFVCSYFHRFSFSFCYT